MESAVKVVELLYQLEPFSSALFEEIRPLAEEHHAESSYVKDLPLDIDFERYARVHEFGALRMFTARQDGELVGYMVFTVCPSLHSKGVIQASTDAVFIRKEHRGFGGNFIGWCDGVLTAEGVHVVYQIVKKACDYGPMLIRKGYSEDAITYAKRLNQNG